MAQTNSPYGINLEEEYGREMDRTHTIDSILSLDVRFTREYLSTKSLDALHDLEDSLLNAVYETL